MGSSTPSDQQMRNQKRLPAIWEKGLQKALVKLLFKKKSQSTCELFFVNFSKQSTEGPQYKLYHSRNVWFLTTFCSWMSKSVSDFPTEALNESWFQIFVLPDTACRRHITVFLNSQEINCCRFRLALMQILRL